jgi:hypothetical protein
MPIDPIKIPQNVYIEDRIVGPLTLKQIIVVAIGCGFSYAIFAMLMQSFGTVSLPLTVMVWTPGALSFVFAFIKINDLSMLRICLLFMERINKPATRTWAPRRGISINIRTFSTPQKAVAPPPTAAQKKSRQIDELSEMLDSPLDHVDEEPAVASAEEEPRIMRPVDPSKISATPLQQPIDAPQTGGSVSVFRDISPQSPH